MDDLLELDHQDIIFIILKYLTYDGIVVLSRVCTSFMRFFMLNQHEIVKISYNTINRIEHLILIDSIIGEISLNKIIYKNANTYEESANTYMSCMKLEDLFDIFGDDMIDLGIITKDELDKISEVNIVNETSEANVVNEIDEIYEVNIIERILLYIKNNRCHNPKKLQNIIYFLEIMYETYIHKILFNEKYYKQYGKEYNENISYYPDILYDFLYSITLEGFDGFGNRSIYSCISTDQKVVEYMFDLLNKYGCDIIYNFFSKWINITHIYYHLYVSLYNIRFKEVYLKRECPSELFCLKGVHFYDYSYNSYPSSGVQCQDKCICNDEILSINSSLVLELFCMKYEYNSEYLSYLPQNHKNKLLLLNIQDKSL